MRSRAWIAFVVSMALARTGQAGEEQSGPEAPAEVRIVKVVSADTDGNATEEVGKAVAQALRQTGLDDATIARVVEQVGEALKGAPLRGRVVVAPPMVRTEVDVERGGAVPEQVRAMLRKHGGGDEVKVSFVGPLEFPSTHEDPEVQAAVKDLAQAEARLEAALARAAARREESPAAARVDPASTDAELAELQARLDRLERQLGTIEEVLAEIAARE